MSATILKPQPLKKARARHIQGILREIKHCSRRADHPEDRMALAELERELLTIQVRWIRAGLVESLEPDPEVAE